MRKGTNTDSLLFADNDTVDGENVYGAQQILQLTSGQTLTFDLTALSSTDSFNSPSFVFVDLSDLLRDGQLNVVDGEDAVVISARLVLIGTFTPCPGDLDFTGAIDSQDLALLLAVWGGFSADLDGDDVTTSGDLAILLARWGACPQPVE